MSSSPMFHIKPEEIDSGDKREKYTVSVVGCKPIGIIHACLFAMAGFKVICVDPDQNIVNLLQKGKAPNCRHEIEAKLKAYVKTRYLTVTSDIKTAVSQSDVIAITTPVEIGKKKKTDISNLEKACKSVGAHLRQGTLILIVSTVGLGTVENTLKEILENESGLKAGIDFGLAYSPSQILQEQTLEALKDNERIVAALDLGSLNSASTVLEIISEKGLKKTNNVKAAEAMTLFQATQYDVNTALANELAHFCERAGIDYFEVQKLNTNASSKLSTPTLADGTAYGEPYLLLEDAENLNVKLWIVQAAKENSKLVVKQAVNLVADALKSCGKTMRRARISILGISQTQNARSTERETLVDLVNTLEGRGAKTSIYDPFFTDVETTETQVQYKKNLTEAIEGADCLLILTGHDQFKRLNLQKTKAMLKMPAAIVDLEGVFDSGKVEKEGFIYRGLGKGV
ncbi:nucleotide sugar dehydrogenase [Candidatus Bathyarchaeota archaeon]|nr:nucleotide sugar dehydrogenase [Candidatus Bathyarchaeota archaeon]